MVPAIRNAQVANPFGRLFNRFFDDAFAPFEGASAVGNFPHALWHDEDAVYVELDAPGLTETDIEITVRGDDLHVRAERKAEEKKNGYETRAFGRFEQWVRLPVAVDSDKVEAKLANGVLRVKLPKSASAKARKIAVRAE
jgi:HSP20 family protein